MQITLSEEDVNTILESIAYSIQNVRDAQGTPQSIREEKLARLTLAAEKLRQHRQ